MDEKEIEKIAELLKKFPFFPPLDDARLKKIACKFKLKQIPKDNIVFSKGDPGDFFYIVHSGEVKVTTTEKEEEKEVARLKEGDYFGEMALLTGEPRSATVTTITDVVVVALSKTDFDEFLENNPAMALNLSKVLSRRLASMTHKEEKEKPTCSIITVYGVRDRIGKTTLAVNLAISLATSGKKTLLIDLDLQFGDVVFVLNIKPERTIFELMQKKTLDIDLLDSCLFKHHSELKILPAPFKIEQAEMIGEEQILSLINLIKDSYEYVVFDTSSFLSGFTISALDQSKNIVFLVAPDLLILKGSQACLELMNTLQYPPEKIKLVISKLQFSSLDINQQKMEETLRHKIEWSLPFDAQVPQAALKGVPIITSKPNSSYSQAVTKIVKELTGEEVKKVEGKKKGGFKLFGKG